MVVPFRFCALGALVALAAGCGDEMSTAEDPLVSAQSNDDIPTVKLTMSFDGRGILLGGKQELLAFGTPKAEFFFRTASQLGEPRSIEKNEECGTGPLEIASYPEQKFTITFQNNKFAGWINNEDSDDFLSMRRSWLINEPNFAMVEGSSLGEEFTYGPEGETIGGLFKDKSRDPAVISSWSGVNCIFR